jgi:hypothetical protein
MIRLKFTHIFNAIQYILTYLLSLGLAILGAILVYDVSVLLAIIIFIIIVLGFALFSSKILDPLATQLYLKVSCETDVSFDEAKIISYLFDGSMSNGKWYPLEELRNLPLERRKAALFEFSLKNPRY